MTSVLFQIVDADFDDQAVECVIENMSRTKFPVEVKIEPFRASEKKASKCKVMNPFEYVYCVYMTYI